MWFWRATGDPLRVVLSGIAPFLVTKKKQCTVVQELMTLRQSSGRKGIFKPERQMELAEELRELNRRWQSLDTNKGARQEFLSLIK